MMYPRGWSNDDAYGKGVSTTSVLDGSVDQPRGSASFYATLDAMTGKSWAQDDAESMRWHIAALNPGREGDQQRIAALRDAECIAYMRRFQLGVGIALPSYVNNGFASVSAP